jgi:hypothetical protein
MKTTHDRLSVGLSTFLLSSKLEKTWDRVSTNIFSALLLSFEFEQLWDRESAIWLSSRT